MPGTFEHIIILVIVLLIFGGQRLTHIGNELVCAIKGFKSFMKVSEKENNEELTKANPLENISKLLAHLLSHKHHKQHLAFYLFFEVP